jgi:hypothetical protein
MSREEIIRELLDAKKHGWGGGRGKPCLKGKADLGKAVDEAVQFIRSLPPVLPAPSLGDNGEGGICLEWVAVESGGQLRIEFKGSGRISYLVANGDEFREGVIANAVELGRLISEALGGKPAKGGWGSVA